MSCVSTSRVAYVQVSVFGMCRIVSVSFAGFSVRYLRALVCVMHGLESVLCAVFSLCYLQFALTSLVASLRTCLALLGREARGTRTPQTPIISVTMILAPCRSNRLT